MSEEFFRVSELNQFIKDVVNAGFPQAMWICGEIQGYNRNRDKKHVFFELVEKDVDSKNIIARIGLVIFANRKSALEEILQKSENAFSLKDDIEVKFLCQIDFYPVHGAIRLIVESIDPVYTLGKLAQEKQRLIALLKKKGLLDQNKKLSLSPVPLNIGLITSHDSAAYNDFISEFQRSGYAFRVYMRNTLMQGQRAEKDVCQAIDELSCIKNLDGIVITRGGGSIADLSCFDSEKIAEKIATSRLPILSGIGHEINITITDLAAHTYVKTPTAIAHYLVHRIQSFLEMLDEKLQKVLDTASDHLGSAREMVRELAMKIQSQTQYYLKDHIENIIRITEIFKHRPFILMKDQQKNLDHQYASLKVTLKNRLAHAQIQLKSYTKIVDMLHPQKTMKRGFSITRNKSGRLIRNVTDTQKNDELLTELLDGIIKSQVRSVKKEASRDRR